MIAVVVAIDDLLMSVAASIVAALAVTIVVSVAIWGVTKYVDFHQEGRETAAMAALGIGAVGLVLTVGIVVTGIALMVAG